MTEQQPFQLLKQQGRFELRHYPAYVVAEVAVRGGFERASNLGFGPLVGYIGGRNHTTRKIDMTAPVIQEPAHADGQRIAMTAPVIQQPAEDSDHHIVQFVMPATMALPDLPTPADSRVQLRLVPAHDAAVVRYRGFASAPKYDALLTRLLADIGADGFEPAGPPRSARFDPPWTPPFLRHNEVILPVRKTG